MILFINSCTRENSRTKRLADAVLNSLSGEIKEVNLSTENLVTLTGDLAEKRGALCKEGSFDNEIFKYAKDFAKADKILIAAPYWDLSFPALLKRYIELICVTGITFKYFPEGFPIGLCNADKLYYVTTSGGPIFMNQFGFGYVEALATKMFGIKECKFISAQGLDIVGNNAEQILQAAIKNLESMEL